MGVNKYNLLWMQEISFIKEAIEKKGDSKQLQEKSFEQVGNRKKYGFKLDIDEPKIGGSAVARDLLEVLKKDSEFIEITKRKHIVIRMGRNFVLTVEVSNKL